MDDGFNLVKFILGIPWIVLLSILAWNVATIIIVIWWVIEGKLTRDEITWLRVVVLASGIFGTIIGGLLIGIIWIIGTICNTLDTPIFKRR